MNTTCSFSPADLSALIQAIIALCAAITTLITILIHQKMSELPTKAETLAIAESLKVRTAQIASELPKPRNP
jgi:hypothetical protein